VDNIKYSAMNNTNKEALRTSEVEATTLLSFSVGSGSVNLIDRYVATVTEIIILRENISFGLSL
jgi:hypothetical protein